MMYVIIGIVKMAPKRKILRLSFVSSFILEDTVTAKEEPFEFPFSRSFRLVIIFWPDVHQDDYRSRECPPLPISQTFV